MAEEAIWQRCRKAGGILHRLYDDPDQMEPDELSARPTKLVQASIYDEAADKGEELERRLADLKSIADCGIDDPPNRPEVCGEAGGPCIMHAYLHERRMREGAESLAAEREKEIERLEVLANHMQAKRGDAESALAEKGTILNWIGDVLQGGEPTDFALSFPEVRAIVDLQSALAAAQGEVERLRERLTESALTVDNGFAQQAAAAEASATRYRADCERLAHLIRKWVDGYGDGPLPAIVEGMSRVSAPYGPDAVLAAASPRAWDCVCGHPYEQHRPDDHCSLCACRGYVDGPASAGASPVKAEEK